MQRLVVINVRWEYDLRERELSISSGEVLIHRYFGSGAGTRTPDTRIMIPLL